MPLFTLPSTSTGWTGALSRCSDLPARLLQCVPRYTARVYFSSNKACKQGIRTHSWPPHPELFQLSRPALHSAPTSLPKLHTQCTQSLLLLKANFPRQGDDADPGLQDPCVVAAMDRFTRTTESCGGKGMARPLSQGESTPTLALTGFYCFSGHITLRMVLIYYTQVCFRWLHFTENKGEDVANYIKKEGYLQM